MSIVARPLANKIRTLADWAMRESSSLRLGVRLATRLGDDSDS